MAPDKPKPMLSESPARDKMLTPDQVKAAAETVRRIRGEEIEEGGLRRILHRGKNTSHLFSWESPDNKLVRQEARVGTILVLFDKGKGIRTARIPSSESTPASPTPMGNKSHPDDIPNAESLNLTSHFLKQIRKRDVYAQHLLKEINHAIEDLGYDDAQTRVASIKAFSRPTVTQTTIPITGNPLERTVIHTTKSSAPRRTLFFLGTFATIGLLAGLALAYWLGLIG